MIAGSLARRYARALMQIGLEQQSYERFGEELRSLAQAYKTSSELATVLSNPALSREDREKVLTALMQRLGMSEITVNFCRLLLERERVVALPDISRELDAMIDEQAGRVKAVITSAVPLSSAQQTAVLDVLEKLSGKTIFAETRHDPALLGGVIAQVGDQVYDGSLRTQLREMQQRLA